MISLRSFAVPLLALAATGPLAAQRQLATGVHLASGANGAWVDLGSDVLAIAGSGPGSIAAIRRASGKPIRAAIALNGSTPIRGATELAPNSRDAAGALGFHGSIFLGARRVEVREVERAVSPGNAIVWVPDASVLFAGDLVGDGARPDSVRTEAWLTVLEKLMKLSPKVVVPGRGQPGGPELLERARDAIVAARAEARRAVERKIPVDRAGSGANAGLVRHAIREMVGLAPTPLFDALELRPGTTLTSRTAGWTRPKSVVVVDMWNKPGRLAELEYVAPGVEIKVAKSVAEAAGMVAGADAYMGQPSGDVIRRGTTLRWIQSASAGVEGPLSIPGFADGPVILTNAQRVYGPPLAEHVLGLMLGLTRKIQVAATLAQERAWRDTMFVSPEMPELRGKTLLVVGLGGIGIEVANLAHGMGMRVIATRNNKSAPTATVEYVGSPAELADLVAQADFIANCVPLTPATANVFDEAMFRRMKPTAIFVNIGRGGTVDTEALTRALEEKRLGGAGLDVTRPEPLPATHRLWTLPNVIITPHVGSSSDLERERTWLLFRENLRRFAAGEPLLSVVDKKAAY